MEASLGRIITRLDTDILIRHTIMLLWEGGLVPILDNKHDCITVKFVVLSDSGGWDSEGVAGCMRLYQSAMYKLRLV